MPKTKWPDEVPVLEGKDFVQGPMRNFETGARCTVSWCWEAFRLADLCLSDGERHIEGLVYETLNDTARQFRAEFSEPIGNGSLDSPEYYSDNKSNPPELLARIWNASMERLGYTKLDPEAKHLKRK